MKLEVAPEELQSAAQVSVGARGLLMVESAARPPVLADLAECLRHAPRPLAGGWLAIVAPEGEPSLGEQLPLLAQR